MDHQQQLREDAAAFDFVARFLADRERGAEQGLAEYQALFPEFAERIATEHAALLGVAEAADEASLDGERRIGPYRLIEQLGQGGQGVVFRAEHTELRRIVALKMLHTGLLGLDAARRARLRREAITVARLDHPGICGVYEVELDGPHPYLAMRFVAGRSLATEIEHARRQQGHAELPPETRAQIDDWIRFFEQAALALHAAHQAGIVHRDIKPHNLMRTPDGEPVLLDFGLARDATSTSGSLTGSHELFGTLAYMAPELLSGKVAPHPSQDVYALGATLYEVLTLQQPFAAATREALWRRIESGQVARARELNAKLPRDLDLIVATAMERDPVRRYATALAFAEDLRRVHQREPILARPLSRRVRLLRWSRKHPAVSVAMVLLAIGFAVALTLYAEVARSNSELFARNRQLSALQLKHSALTRSENEPVEALQDAVRAARDLQGDFADPEVAAILIEVLDRCYVERFFMRHGNADFTRCVVVNRTGETAAVPNLSGSVAVLQARDGALVGATPGDGQSRAFAAFGGEPELLLVAGGDGVLRGHELAGLECVRSWSGVVVDDARPAGRTTALAVSADGRFAARGDETGSVDLVDLAAPDSESAAVRRRVHDSNISFAAFDPTGTRLLTFSKDHPGGFEGDGTAMLLERTTGVRTPIGHWPGKQSPSHAAWSPDGTSIAIAHSDGVVRVFDTTLEPPVERFVIRHSVAMTYVGFDPVRPHLWTCSTDGVVVYDCATGREWRRVSDFAGRSPNMIAFRDDGAEAAVVANDATTRILDAATLRERRRLIASSRAEGVAWAIGSARVLTVTSGTLTSWFAAARPFLPELAGHTAAVTQVQFDPAGTTVLTASADGTARRWDATSGAELQALPHGAPVRTARFATDGRSAVTTCEQGPARVWLLEPPTAIALGTAPATDAWFFDEDRRVVTVADDGWLRIFEANGRQLGAHQAHPPVPEWTGLGRGETRIRCAAWHPDRPWLATGAGARVVTVFDCLAQREVFRSTPWPDPEGYRRAVFHLAFSPDRDTLVASGQDLRLHGWSITTGRDCWTQSAGTTPGELVFVPSGAELLVNARYSAGVSRVGPDPSAPQGQRRTVYTPRIGATALRLDPTGKHVLCADMSGRLAVFATDPWRQILTLRASTVALRDAAFSPDGRSIVTGDAEGRVRIWPVDPLPVAERAIPPLISVDAR